MHTLDMNEAYTSSHLQLAKTLPFAVVLHAALILGVSFAPELLPKLNIPPVLDVTLVQTHSETAPDEAEFIAQANQQASGSSDESNRPRSPLASMEPNAQDGESPLKSVEAAPENSPKLQPQLLTTKGETFKRIDKAPEQPDKDPVPVAETPSDQTQEIARLLAEVDEAEALYARRPRIHFIDSVSTKSSVEAFYIDSWVKKIERVGNINFPDEAINRNLSGKLILNATLDHGGNVVDIQIGVSSGFNLLDKAALRIVKLASPYPPLPWEIREQWDQLNITRTWIFHSGTLDTE
uniref:Energy transducer TonB n=1 Tax=uncultured Thiotrichaceae bacterium TaxID=298394 RepID=A0A6S6SUA9_9GAMM|nr:MAG: Energy transducer TonB [uncultured Thiotrichaceae bacterium]